MPKVVARKGDEGDPRAVGQVTQFVGDDAIGVRWPIGQPAMPPADYTQLIHAYHSCTTPALSSSGKRVTRGAILDANKEGAGAPSGATQQVSLQHSRGLVDVGNRRDSFSVFDFAPGVLSNPKRQPQVTTSDSISG